MELIFPDREAAFNKRGLSNKEKRQTIIWSLFQIFFPTSICPEESFKVITSSAVNSNGVKWIRSRSFLVSSAFDFVLPWNSIVFVLIELNDYSPSSEFECIVLDWDYIFLSFILKKFATLFTEFFFFKLL